MDDKAEKIALFRYGVVAPLVLEALPRGELTRRAQEIAARQYDIPYSSRRSLSVDTLLEWALNYRKNGIAALVPKPRQDRGQARAVTPETAALIERLKRENPHRTGTALLRELALAGEHNQAGLSASTFYRFLRARGLTERQLLEAKTTAHKKYEAEYANQIWGRRAAIRGTDSRDRGSRPQVTDGGSGHGCRCASVSPRSGMSGSRTPSPKTLRRGTQKVSPPPLQGAAHVRKSPRNVCAMPGGLLLTYMPEPL